MKKPKYSIPAIIKKWEMAPKPSFTYNSSDDDEEEYPFSTVGHFIPYKERDFRERNTWHGDVRFYEDKQVRLVLFDDDDSDHCWWKENGTLTDAEELFRWVKGLVLWDLQMIRDRMVSLGFKKE